MILELSKRQIEDSFTLLARESVESLCYLQGEKAYVICSCLSFLGKITQPEADLKCDQRSARDRRFKSTWLCLPALGPL